MFDLNNPYLSAQQKNDMLALEVSAEYREEKRLMAEAGMPFSSPSYWVLTFREFKELVEASNSLNTHFTGKLGENQVYPEYQVLLMEHDRIEAGEWDYFYKRFNPIGYQNVCVICVNGFLKGEVPKCSNEVESPDFNSSIFCPCWEEVGEDIKDYKETAYWIKRQKPFFPFAIWDIRIDELNKYEERRVWKRTYYFSPFWEILMKEEAERHQPGGQKCLNKKAKQLNQTSIKGFSCYSRKKKKKKKYGGKKK
jgi:hypothetical protein